MLEKYKHHTLVLASKSPRRRELLSNLGFKVVTRPVEVEETYPAHLTPPEVALYLAALKAEACPVPKEKEIWITSDTIVYLDNEVMGKPANSKEATAMLKKLSGNKHDVVTAVCMRSSLYRRSFFVRTKVTFKRFSSQEIQYYIEHYKPFDKAGAYGIQEWLGMIGIEKIKGCYYNVMGLPLNQLYVNLQTFPLL